MNSCGSMILPPEINPFHKPPHVGLQVLRALAPQLYHDFLGVRGPGFVQNNLHDLCFVIFLDLFQWVPPRPPNSYLIRLSSLPKWVCTHRLSNRSHSFV